MKLNIISLAALFACAPLVAANQSGQEVADLLESNLGKSAENIAMIEFSVVLYKDRTESGHDAKAWEAVLQKTTKSLRAVNDGIAWPAALADIFSTARSSSAEGIHGEISVNMSDGNHTTRCGENCACVTRYKGNCPCSLREESCSARNGDDEEVDGLDGLPDEEELFLADDEDESGSSCSACHNFTQRK